MNLTYRLYQLQRIDWLIYFFSVTLILEDTVSLLNSNSLNISWVPIIDEKFTLCDESILYTIYYILDVYPFFVDSGNEPSLFITFSLVFLYFKWYETKRYGSSWLLPYLPTLGWTSFLTPGTYSLGLPMHSKSKYGGQRYRKSMAGIFFSYIKRGLRDITKIRKPNQSNRARRSSNQTVNFREKWSSYSKSPWSIL